MSLLIENLDLNNFVTTQAEILVPKKKKEFKYNKEKIVESYFRFIVNKEFDKAFETFEELLHFPNSKIYIYLCFWYSFSLSEEDLVKRIFNKTEIQFKNMNFNESNQFTISAKELNTYAIEIAMGLKLSDYLISLIIAQGKISVELEWISEQIDQDKFELIERMWRSKAECRIVSEKLKSKFKALITREESNIPKENLIRKISTIFDNKSKY